MPRAGGVRTGAPLAARALLGGASHGWCGIRENVHLLTRRSGGDPDEFLSEAARRDGASRTATQNARPVARGRLSPAEFPQSRGVW